MSERMRVLAEGQVSEIALGLESEDGNAPPARALEEWAEGWERSEGPEGTEGQAPLGCSDRSPSGSAYIMRGCCPGYETNPKTLSPERPT